MEGRVGASADRCCPTSGCPRRTSCSDPRTAWDRACPEVPVGDTWRLVPAIRPLAGSARLDRIVAPTLAGVKGEHTMMRSIAAVLSVLALEACATGKVLEPATGA